MQKPKRDFKGIWIPKEVWLNEKLTTQEKLFLVEIDSLDNEDGCWATNQYFSSFFDLSIRRCSQIIGKLKEKSFITITLIKDEVTNEVKKRILRVNRNMIYSIEENFHTPIERNVYTPIEESFHTLGKECSRGIEGKFQENNTSNNTLNNTIKNKNSMLQSEETTSKEVVISKEFKDSLVEKWNSIESIPNIKALRHGTKRYDSLKARLDEFSEDEILLAINNITKSDFLQGKNNRGWTITFDWFVKPNNFIKVLENQYKNNDTQISDLGIDESKYTPGQLIDIKNAAKAEAEYDEEEAYILELMERSKK